MTKVATTMTFDEMAKLYCEKQESTPKELKQALQFQKQHYNPNGWMLLEAQDMSSSWLGQLVILPYGPNNTFKEPPAHPISPGGLASDMSVIIGVMPACYLGD